MSIQSLQPYIEKPDADSARLARHPRVRVAQIVMDYLAHGWSAEEICRQHSYLRPAEVHAAMAYYYDHREEVDDEIRREMDEIEEARRVSSPSPFVQRMKAEGRM